MLKNRYHSLKLHRKGIILDLFLKNSCLEKKQKVYLCACTKYILI